MFLIRFDGVSCNSFSPKIEKKFFSKSMWRLVLKKVDFRSKVLFKNVAFDFFFFC